MGWYIFSAVYAVLNLISFAMYAIDKRKAIKNQWRISEASLLIAAALGIIGGFCGMYVLRHKTKHAKFYIGLPLIFIAELAIAGFILFKFVL